MVSGRKTPAPRPFKTLSERLAATTKDDGTKPNDDPLEIARRKLYGFLNSHLGYPLAALAVGIASLCIDKCDTVKSVPSVERTITSVYNLARGLPEARADRFSIVIARLENDTGDFHRRMIRDALATQFDRKEDIKHGEDIQLLLVDQSIAVGESETPQEAMHAGHDRARRLLRRMKADLMIWGEVLDSKPEAPMRLHWTLNLDIPLMTPSEKYQLSDDGYDLPDRFRNHLRTALMLLARSEATSSSSQNGTYTVDRLRLSLERIRGLVDSKWLVGQH